MADVLAPMFEVIAACDRAIAKYDEVLEQLAKTHPVASKVLATGGGPDHLAGLPRRHRAT
ncbi:MAG: hypothetical protein ACK4YP_04765 [Myxococcota bacterium]